MAAFFARVREGLVALLLTVAPGAHCADLVPAPPAPLDMPELWTSTLYAPTNWEIRGGVFDSIYGRESGTFDVNGEIVLPKFYTVPDFVDIFIPRLHVGGMGNLEGQTSYAYAGALWTLNYTQHLFGELFVGGAIHDGPLSEFGCRELIHAGTTFGYRIDNNWSAMITFDHLSNGEPTLSHCSANQSINILGLRFGYSF